MAAASGPKPSRATPVLQAPSLKLVPRQAVPWSDPSSRYLQVAPSGESTVLVGGKFWNSSVLLPVMSALTGFSRATRKTPVKLAGRGI